ncbi:dinucleotide-utilizing enzyme [Microbacterium sp. KSW4-11]|uniref:Dinucleotide-utilizing enzyme n=1 Tax=Microbacterium gawkjiense TaxID=3067309 RepID=A0ABU3GAR7_9MICO|nr:dinucleotide-utilizing enzyme [Microbacterium sp. KSW4-11]MDT3316902.1 dinucleotide-utilizing enzyme [Microbacterium sp. KSW4-11]
MNTRPRLTRSIPFWLLVAGSLASGAAGGVVLMDKLAKMETALTAGTATGVDVYVGQIWAVLGAILVGVGAIGLLLAFTLGALRAFVVAPRAQRAVDDEPATAQDAAATGDAPASAAAQDGSDTTPHPVLDGAGR